MAQSDVDNYIVSVDPEGVLGWASKYIEKRGRPRAHVIEVLTGQVSDAYLAYLRGFDISYIFAGNKTLDCALALWKLKELFRSGGILPPQDPAAFTLKDAKRLEGDGLWLSYLKQEGTR